MIYYAMLTPQKTTKFSLSFTDNIFPYPGFD